MITPVARPEGIPEQSQEIAKGMIHRGRINTPSAIRNRFAKATMRTSKVREISDDEAKEIDDNIATIEQELGLKKN